MRLPYVLRVGPNEGGADEWYAAWRSWCVLFERGDPGNFLHPALFYEAGAALFASIGLLGRLTGVSEATGLVGDFVLHETKYMEALQLLAAAFGALTVPVVFELGRRVGGWRAGAVAAALLAVLPLHVEYSQRLRVDSLCVLLSAVSALALHRLTERGRRRDFVWSGVTIGLATAANYPAALLGIAYLGAAMVARRRTAPAAFARSLALGVVAAAAAFAVTNPYVLLTPGAAWDGFRFQLSLAVKEHPFNEGVSRWFYLQLLRDQGVAFAILAACAGAWLPVRATGFRRVLGAFPWVFIATFVAASNQVDRYILIAMPWLCAAVGVLVADAASGSWVRALLAGTTVALAVVGLCQHVRPFVLVAPSMDEPRGVLQRWLVANAPAGSTIWLEADAIPLLQATFADPGGALQAHVRDAFRRVHPGFDVRVLKGERVARVANYDPALITGKQVTFAVTCGVTVRYAADDSRTELGAQRAFYAALAERGTRRVEDRGCWVVEID